MILRLTIDERIEVEYTGFQTFSDLDVGEGNRIMTSFLGTVETGVSGLFSCLFKNYIYIYIFCTIYIQFPIFRQARPDFFRE